MEQFCLHVGVAVDEWISEIGEGMNFKRKRFLKLMDDIQREAGCELIVVNQESLFPQREMVEDLLAIVHTFSFHLYDLCRYKKLLKDDFIVKK